METVFRGAAIYLALLVITRFSGRRTGCPRIAG